MLHALFLYVCILYPESVVVSFLSASIASESPMNLRVCVCSVGCGCDQCLRRCCISSLRAQSLFNGPIYFGHSLRALPFGRFKFRVDRYTISPFLSGGSAILFLLAWYVWDTQLSMIASCASARLSSACCANFRIPRGVLSCGWYSFIIVGRYPLFSSNGTNFVVWLMLVLIANSVKLTHFIQSFWLG